jgi:hypothetical protein
VVSTQLVPLEDPCMTFTSESLDDGGHSTAELQSGRNLNVVSGSVQDRLSLLQGRLTSFRGHLD